VTDEDVARLRSQLKALYRRLRRELPPVPGLTLTTLQLLVAIEKSTVAISSGGLASVLQMTDSNVATALRSLESEGLIERHRDSADGRKVFIRLTRGGAELVAEARASLYGWLREAIEGLLSEKEQRLLLHAGELMQRLSEYVPPAEAQPRIAVRRLGRGRIG
jgi:DNA-binding MarR family transcriptional regulator